MLTQLKLCVNHGRRINGTKTLTFKPGLNVIAGPNGSGKSTILRAIDLCDDCVKIHDGETFFHYFNCETMNPRTAEGPANNITNMILRIRSLFSSHGQIMKEALRSIPIKNGDCLLIDEPETGQDMEGILKIKTGFEAICEKGGQVIVATHHPALWKNVHLIELEEGYSDKVRENCRKIL